MHGWKLLPKTNRSQLKMQKAKPSECESQTSCNVCIQTQNFSHTHRQTQTLWNTKFLTHKTDTDPVKYCCWPFFLNHNVSVQLNNIRSGKQTKCLHLMKFSWREMLWFNKIVVNKLVLECCLKKPKQNISAVLAMWTTLGIKNRNICLLHQVSACTLLWVCSRFCATVTLLHTLFWLH